MGDDIKLAFHSVAEPNQLLSVLEERLPKSCFAYNQVILYPNFKEDLTFFTLGKEINSNTWIVVIHRREDYGSFVTISAPIPIVEGNEQIPLNIKKAFSTWNIIEWDESMVFAALEKPISAMIVDISANVKGNVTELHPCILYYMDLEEALKLEICPSPGSEVRRLETEEDGDFILKGWKYSKEGSDMVTRKSIKGAASAGVFVDGKCVSGVITPGVGLISALYTLREYRNRGFAKLTMRYAFKECAKGGCIPCSTVEARNGRSIAFHQSLGVKSCSIVDYIDVKKLEVD